MPPEGEHGSPVLGGGQVRATVVAGSLLVGFATFLICPVQSVFTVSAGRTLPRPFSHRSMEGSRTLQWLVMRA